MMPSVLCSPASALTLFTLFFFFPRVFKRLIDGGMKMHTSNIRRMRVTSPPPINRRRSPVRVLRCHALCHMSVQRAKDVGSPGLHISTKAFRCLGWEATRTATRHFPLTSEPGQLILAARPEAAASLFFFVVVVAFLPFICTERFAQICAATRSP